MKNLKRRWTAVMLIVTVIFGLFPIGNVFAASDVLDQQQTNGSGNTWVNSTYPKYQTFTPAISGNLSRFELNSAGSYGATGAMLLSLYKESDLSTPLASTQLTSFGSGWVSVDFTGIAPYLKRNMEYRMIVSTEYGGSAGFGWYMTGGDPYPRGTSPSIGYDFAFRTYMIPDYSLSPAESKVTTAQSSLEADGTSQTMVSVQLNDAQGNAITSGGAAVAITSTLGTVSPVTDNNNGTYTATLTAPATVGTATVSASVGGSPIASTATVQFVPGAPSAANSTLTVGGTSLTANGTSQTSIIVKLKDMHGNSLTKGGAAVAITSTLGTVGTVTDDNNGTYTAMLTAPTTVGTATVSANIGGSAIASTAKVQFVPGVASTARSTVTVGNASLTADGTSRTTVTVTLKDAQGNALTVGGSSVAITTTLGTVGPVTDNNNGTYTAMLTAPMIVGTATVSASIGGSAIASTVTVQFVPGAASTSRSTVVVGNATLTADGVSQTTVTVKLNDAQGNALTVGGATVAITTTLGSIGPVTDNNNGTYTATLTAPATVGNAIVGASVGGRAIASTATVQFIPGAASATLSTVAAGNASLTADGASQTTVTVKLNDAQGNALTIGGTTVAITTTLGTVGPVTDNNNGTYTATLKAPAIVGTATVSASIGGSAIASTVTVQFVPGVASTSRSTVVVGNATLTADGVSQTTVTVKLNDAQGNALTVGGATVAITTTLGTVGPVTDNNNGTYTATLTAPSTVGIATVGASVYGSELASTTAIQFLPGEVSAVHSTVTASDLVIRADGISKASIFVKLKDDYDHPLAGKRVSLQASGGHSVMADVYGWTDSMGLAAFSVSNTTAESVTFFAKEEQSGQSLHQNVTIKFTYNQPPTITLQANPFLPTFGNVTVSVATSVYGQFNRVSSIKWAAGSHPLSYFETQGMEIADYFTVQKNGVYSVYVADTAGNANIGFIDIQNIVPLSNNASLSNWQLAGLGGTVPFDEFDPGTTSYSVLVSPAVYGLTMKLIPSDVYSVVYVNGGQVANSVITNAYSLVTGKNTFEVNVKAQDGSLKTYTLDVIRASASSGSHSGSGTVSSSTDSSPDNAVSIWINDQKLSGHASVRMEANGTKSIDVRLDTDTVIKVIDSFTTTTERSISIMVDDEAGKIALQLSGEAAALLAQKGAALTLKTQQAQYRLPLAEVVNGISAWSKDTGVQITIERGKLNEIPELQDAARKGDFQWMTDPVHFHVYVLRQSESIEVSNFKHYVERVIYLPKGLDRTASTVVAWDQMHGVRPVPTAFMSIDGREAAVIRSLTNSTYGLVSKASSLTDIQGHWAAAEIVDLNKRLIVNGIDEKRFVPDSVITRAELAALLTRALGLPKGSGHAGFRDVSDSSWYSDSIAAVKANGLMDGFQDGTFGPNQEVSRQEAVVTIIRAMQLAGATSEASRARVKTDLSEYVDRNQIGDWASAAIQTGIHEGLVEGYGNELRPLKSLTRAETVVLIYRLLLKANFINK